MRVWRQGLLRKNKEPYKVLMNPFSEGSEKGLIRAVGFRCLSRVKSTDKLYIYAHGAAGTGLRMGGARDSGSVKSYSAPELADLLVKEGLSKTHRDLRLYFCESGLGDEPFALQIRNAMVARGYRLIQVTGFMGDIRPSYAIRQTENGGYTNAEHKGVERDGYILRASQFRRVF
jgi:hypothetical protein